MRACPGRGTAFFTLLRRTGTHSFVMGPGSAARYAVKNGALRCVRGTAPP